MYLVVECCSLLLDFFLFGCGSLHGKSPTSMSSLWFSLSVLYIFTHVASAMHFLVCHLQNLSFYFFCFCIFHLFFSQHHLNLLLLSSHSFFCPKFACVIRPPFSLYMAAPPSLPIDFAKPGTQFRGHLFASFCDRQLASVCF